MALAGAKHTCVFERRVKPACRSTGSCCSATTPRNEHAEITFVRVHKPDGSLVTTTSASVQDLSSPVQRIAPVYTDFRQKHVTVQSRRPGDILEFSVVTSIHDVVSCPARAAHGEGFEESRARAISAAARAFSEFVEVTSC